MVSAKQFIEAWQGSTSLSQVAKKTGAKKNACRMRGWRYRKLGIPLKDFPAVQVEAIDWRALAEYAASLEPAR